MILIWNDKAKKLYSVVCELLKEAFSLIILSTFVSLLFCQWRGSQLNWIELCQGFITYQMFSLVSIMNWAEIGWSSKEREKIKGNESENVLLRLPIYYIIDWEYNKIWYDIPRHILRREWRFDEPYRILFQSERYKLADSFIVIKLFKLHVKLFNIFLFQ